MVPFNSFKLCVVSVLVLLCISESQSADTSCLPAFIQQVDVAADLKELLVIAKDIANTTNETFTEWQEDTRGRVRQGLLELQEKMISFHFQYDGKVRNFFPCKNHHNNAVKAFEKAQTQLQALIHKDDAPVVAKKYAGKFQANVEYVQKLLAKCTDENCADEEKDVQDVKARLRKSVHDEWCKDVNGRLNDEEKQAADVKDKAFSQIDNARWWLDSLPCKKG